MAFLRDFDCDVFVSYATANNQSLAEGKNGWVTSLCDNITKFLDEGLDRRNASFVWIDRNLRGNDRFDEQLAEKVQKSAILLVVLSDAYLASPWCRRELEIFSSTTHGGLSRAGCVFLVHYEPVPVDRWPKEIGGLSTEKYRFFQQEHAAAPSKPLGFPIPNPDMPAHLTYYDRLILLRSELASQLKEMQKRQGIPPPPGPPGPASSDGGTTIYLAEVTGDTLFDQRTLVKSHLEKVGLRVLPATSYSRDPADYARELERDLEQCRLFVQMLGRFPTGFEQLQHERALAAGKELLRWRSRDLVLDGVPDQAHRDLLERDDVKAMDFDELKRTIVDRARVLAVKSDVAIDGDRFILVNAAKEDDALADEIANQLATWGAGFDVVNGNRSLTDLVKSNSYDALLVVYGRCDTDWVHQQLRTCRGILLDRKKRSPACAVYIGPPDSKERLRCRPPGVTVIGTRDQTRLQSFIQQLSSSGVSA
jgi:hypothetical protein